MSAAVDVLAVMDLSCKHMGVRQPGRAGCIVDMEKARAAVAELIGAAKALRSTAPTYSIAYGQAEQLLDAALARVGAA